MTTHYLQLVPSDPFDLDQLNPLLTALEMSKRTRHACAIVKLYEQAAAICDTPDPLSDLDIQTLQKISEIVSNLDLATPDP
jgi:hypothetical protein